RAAVFFRNSAAHEAHFSGFFHERGHQSGLFVFQVLHQRQNFLHHKFFSRLPHQLLIVGQISGRKHVARLRRFQQEAASLCCRLGQGRGGHSGFSEREVLAIAFLLEGDRERTTQQCHFT